MAEAAHAHTGVVLNRPFLCPLNPICNTIEVEILALCIFLVRELPAATYFAKPPMDLQINDARSLNLTEDVLDAGSGTPGGLGLTPGAKLAPRGRESVWGADTLLCVLSPSPPLCARSVDLRA